MWSIPDFRHSNYNLAGGVNTYKFEVQYSPIEDIRFRGGYQRAIRAPNILELYTPPGFGLLANGPGIDPCAPTRDTVTGALIPATATLAECQRTGVTAAEYGNGGTTNSVKQCVALQCAQLTGGNMALKPEQADSVTFGLNFDPASCRASPAASIITTSSLRMRLASSRPQSSCKTASRPVIQLIAISSNGLRRLDCGVQPCDAGWHRPDRHQYRCGRSFWSRHAGELPVPLRNMGFARFPVFRLIFY